MKLCMSEEKMSKKGKISLFKSQKGPVLGWKSSRKLEKFSLKCMFQVLLLLRLQWSDLIPWKWMFFTVIFKNSFSKENYHFSAFLQIPILSRKEGSTKLLYPINLGPYNDKNCMSGYVSGGRKLGIKSKTVFEKLWTYARSKIISLNCL